MKYTFDAYRTAIRDLQDLATEVGELWVTLELFIEAGSAPPDPNARRAVRCDPPAPVNLDAIVLRDERTAETDGSLPVAKVVRRAARTVAAGRHLSGVPSSVPSQARMIATHAEWIVEQPWAASLTVKLQACVKALRRATGDYGHPPLGDCPSVLVDPDEGLLDCDGKLWPMKGTLGVRCDGAGRHRWAGPAELGHLRLLLGGEA